MVCSPCVPRIQQLRDSIASVPLQASGPVGGNGGIMHRTEAYEPADQTIVAENRHRVCEVRQANPVLHQVYNWPWTQEKQMKNAEFDRQQEVIQTERKYDPSVSQRALAKLIHRVYSITFGGMSYAAVYAIVRRYDARQAKIVKDAVAGAMNRGAGELANAY